MLGLSKRILKIFLGFLVFFCLQIFTFAFFYPHSGEDLGLTWEISFLGEIIQSFLPYLLFNLGMKLLYAKNKKTNDTLGIILIFLSVKQTFFNSSMDDRRSRLHLERHIRIIH